VLPILLLLALLQPAPPALTATWAGSTRAVIAWQQQPGVAVTCLSRNTTLIRCWTNAPAGKYVVELGGPLTDGNLRPQPHDVFRLFLDGHTASATLRSVTLLPMI